MIICPSLRFNGATSFQTWKPPPGYASGRRYEELQWGHVFSDVETRRLMSLQQKRYKLQWGHVFSDVETIIEILTCTEKAQLQWGHVFSDVETFPKWTAARPH